MVVGTLKVRLLIRESRSLKDKRQVVRSIKERMHQSFGVAAAEVDSLEDHRVAVLGFAVVSNDHSHAQNVLDQVVGALRSHPVAEFLGMEVDVRTMDS